MPRISITVLHDSPPRALRCAGIMLWNTSTWTRHRVLGGDPGPNAVAFSGHLDNVEALVAVHDKRAFRAQPAARTRSHPQGGAGTAAAEPASPSIAGSSAVAPHPPPSAAAPPCVSPLARLVSGSRDGQILIWEPVGWTCERALQDVDRVACLAVIDNKLVSGGFVTLT